MAKDTDILRRRWLLIDADPVRDPHISATDAEKDAARRTIEAVRAVLAACGWPQPILCDSGNGFHLLYRIDLPVEDGGLVERVLRAVAQRFDSLQVKIDCSVHNPSRICKLPGTLARKGDSISARPHRWSAVLEMPPESSVVPEPLLQALAAEAPSASVSASATPPPFNTSKGARRPPSGSGTSRLLVERWLSDRGVAFRVKPEPEGRGRVVFVLEQCPFDPSHRDPDSCIMQDPSGKFSAKCFHNSCQGRGWRHFKQRIGAPEAHHYDPPLRHDHSPRSHFSGAEAPGNADFNHEGSPDAETEGSATRATNGLPWIQSNHRQLRDVSADAFAALVAGNDPPYLFQRGGALCRLRVRDEQSAPVIETLDDAALRGVLARCANWMRVRLTQKGRVEEEDAPPLEVVRDLASLPAWDQIPRLDAVVECPVFTKPGNLIREPGFHASARLWLHPAEGLWWTPKTGPRVELPCGGLRSWSTKGIRMNKLPRVHTSAFKAQVALAALKGDRTLSEFAAQHQVHVKLVQTWKKQMLEQAATVFASSVKPVSLKESEAKQAELFEQIGRLKMELEWLKKKAAAFV